MTLAMVDLRCVFSACTGAYVGKDVSEDGYYDQLHAVKTREPRFMPRV